jgi:hypothetical protein
MANIRITPGVEHYIDEMKRMEYTKETTMVKYRPDMYLTSADLQEAYERLRHCPPRRNSCKCPVHLRERLNALSRCGCRSCYLEYKHIRVSAWPEEHRGWTCNEYYSEVFAPLTETRVINQLSSGENMNIVDKVKNLKLSSADKLLRKHSIVDAEGDLTGAGKELIWGMLLEEYKDVLVADLKEVEKADKAKK